MEYHADRFLDHSLIAYIDDTPIALLPANLKNNVLYSHQGLTFGGWITDSTMKTVVMLLLFEHLIDYLKAQGIEFLIYKCIPYLYHHIPAEEDVYALFRHKAWLVQCDVTTAITISQPLPFSDRRKRGISKAKKAGVLVKECNDYETFFAMLEWVLKEKHNSIPTHNLEELVSLSQKFSKNIRLYAAYNATQMLAGAIIYESEYVAHVQYIASNEDGRKSGALDAVFNHLIHQVYSHKRYFDFGTSNGLQGHYLNEGLIEQKEEFGARAVVHNIYKIDLSIVGT